MTGMLSELGERLGAARRMLEWRALAVRTGQCPLCGATLFVRLSWDPLGARCVRCAAWPVSMAMGRVVEALPRPLARSRVYEASSRGPFVSFLSRRAGELVVSEYWEDVPPGETRGDAVCQDLERLTFPDASFDLCTSTEVFEHVADDAAGFRELHRVLRPSGFAVLSVPLFARPQTVERCRRGPDGEIEHLLPPEYHDDRIRGAASVLVHREYGEDIVERVSRAGFVDVRIREESDPTGFGHRPRIVVARRPS